ncbi:MAG: HAD-IIIA family hydrolase [Sulfurimonas sp.]|jgi:3-deoxy-D-manno-octulosonate 8-phosphate phosphatase (KDO 8-P phosphatase)
MIRLIFLDVDGCLSDGKITYTHDGIELKSFNVRDGFAIKTLAKMGYTVAIITGRDSTIVELRAKELDILYLFQGVKDKQAVAEKLCQQLNIRAEEVAAIGDDLNDYRLLQWVGMAFIPNDASEYLKPVAQLLERKGGDACVREMIEKILIANGDEERFLNLWI